MLLISEVFFWILGYFTLQIFGFFSSGKVGEKLVFISPNYQYWFILIPILFVLFFLILKRRNRMVEENAHTSLSSSYLSPISNSGTFLRFLLIRNIVAFLILAAMQPAFGSKKVNGKVNGVELVFAVDISVSMNTQDMDGRNSRLDIAKRTINQFINLTNSGKVGMVVFAGSAYPQLPLTADFDAAKMYADEISTDFISNQGTNIGLALEMSQDFFTKEKTRKVIVLITDGEDHEKGVGEAIETLNKKGIELGVLGLGSSAGGLIPINIRNKAAGYIKDDYGKTIVSKVNEDMLKDLAIKAKGELVISADDFPNVSSLLAQINSLETTKSIEIEFEVEENRYTIFLFIAILLLIALIVIEEFSKMKIKRT